MIFFHHDNVTLDVDYSDMLDNVCQTFLANVDLPTEYVKTNTFKSPVRCETYHFSFSF